jgi:ABC-type transport system substrate-binding protein
MKTKIGSIHKKSIFVFTFLILMSVGLLIFNGRIFFVKPNIQIEILKTSLRVINQFPDPAEIDTAGKWYLLGHISSPLIEYDHKNSSMLPMIAKKWDIQGSKYTLTINNEVKFSDGTPIKAHDVAASIKRIIAKKTSLHFPLWKHIADCENVKTLDDVCQGISSNDDTGTVEIILLTKSESFLLQLSSPEGGIWSAEDINPKTLELKPTKFSGPYALTNLVVNANNDLVLKRNPYSITQKLFPDSPKEIWVRALGRAQVEKSIANSETDIFIGDFIPFNDHDWDNMPELGTHYTTPSSLIYFFNLNTKNKIGLDFINELSKFPDRRVTFAQTILPIVPSIALSPKEVEELLPKTSSRELSVAAPGYYFKDKTLDFIEAAAKKAGIHLVITKVDPQEFMQLYESDTNFKSKYDFVLANYVASERYPAVQLRFLTGHRLPGVELNDIEAPDQDENKINRLKEYQRWLIRSQLVIPFYFTRTHIVYSKKFDVGSQPLTDAEIQLWRVTKKVD